MPHKVDGLKDFLIIHLSFFFNHLIIFTHIYTQRLGYSSTKKIQLLMMQECHFMPQSGGSGEGLLEEGCVGIKSVGLDEAL